jgi:membrane protease YdiL (CAAX protease family)
LFALHHFTTPWALVQRTMMTLLVAYAAYHKSNLVPLTIVHFIANGINALPGIQFLMTM